MIQPTLIDHSQLTFRGLWGNADTQIMHNDYSSAINNSIEYYPFRDESSVETDIATGRKWKKPNPFRGMGSFDEFAVRDEVDVMPKLPFTRNEYYMYKNKNSGLVLPELKVKIETTLKKLKLYEYINDYKRPDNLLIKYLKTAAKKFFTVFRK